MTRTPMNVETEPEEGPVESGRAATPRSEPDVPLTPAPDAPSAEEETPALGAQAEDIAQVLGDDARGRSRRLRWYALIAAAAVVAIATILWVRGSGSEAPQYVFAPVERGDLTVVVSATGTLEPTNQVDVGSELSGTIRSVRVDYNDHVRVGEVLATLDTSKLEAQAGQSRAALAAARARVDQAEATVVETRLQLERSKQLFDQELLPRSELDAAEAAFERAQADEQSARAQATQAQATLNAIETDLTKAVIRSPINGIVLVRNVEPGQTVAASFQAPVLFTLAEDLRRMELRVDVDEADVSRVREGQDATFTVDAYPDRHFPATISSVRYASKTVEGVVTYEAILSVDNLEQLLRPGMTASADITVQKMENALLVPNAALRFTPPAAFADLSNRGGLVRLILPFPRRRARSDNETPGGDRAKRGPRVWKLENARPIPIPVTTGPSDGTHTVVLSGDVEPGLALLVDVTSSGQ